MSSSKYRKINNKDLFSTIMNSKRVLYFNIKKRSNFLYMCSAKMCFFLFLGRVIMFTVDNVGVI